MIMNPHFPSGYVVFCDDIRHEFNGKTTQVGIYNGPMILLSALPAIIPQICAVITLRFEPPEAIFKPKFKLFQTGIEQPLFETETEFPQPPADLVPHLPDHDSINFHQLTIEAQLNGLIVTEPCSLKVRAYVGEDEIRLGTLQIIVTSPESTLNANSN